MCQSGGQIGQWPDSADDDFARGGSAGLAQISCGIAWIGGCVDHWRRQSAKAFGAMNEIGWRMRIAFQRPVRAMRHIQLVMCHL